jgi:hypothetical protein
MKGDFTRRTFRRGHHYRSVLLQQGRVALDADWNEQVEIQQHLDEATALDTVGAHGAPSRTAGFAVVARADGGTPLGCAGSDLLLSAGRYYVEGILCENDEEVALAEQPDLPGVALPGRDGRYVAYLDVWREHVTALERPELREVALGGPDTGTRSRTVWQARLHAVDDPQIRPGDVAPPWRPPDSLSTGRLRARAEPGDPATGPCVISPAAGYRRLENQLYRVEIHDGGTGTPSFVWSRDNGSVAARLLALTADPVVTLVIDTPGRDDALGFAKGDWVEVTDLARTRRGLPGFLGRLEEVIGTDLRVVTWSGDTPSSADLTEGAVVRRWDSPGAIPLGAGWVALEDGVQVEFEPDATYRTGDHWLIPARTAALSDTDLDPDLVGTIQWPRDPDGAPAFQSPDGIDHHIAAIALLDRRDGLWTRLYDCRALFAPLVEARPDPPTPPWPAGLHVERVRVTRSGTDLRNDTGIGLYDLLGGITVGLDGPPADTRFTGQSVVTVALDLPYPMTDADRGGEQLAADAVVGTLPLTVAARVTVVDRELHWTPEDAFVGWLPHVLLRVISQRLATRVFCRLTVAGRAVRHAEHPDRVLNGLALTRFRPSDNGTDLVLPTVDDVRGADFTLWFWIDLLQGGIFDDPGSTFDSRLFW